MDTVKSMDAGTTTLLLNAMRMQLMEDVRGTLNGIIVIKEDVGTTTMKVHATARQTI